MCFKKKLIIQRKCFLHHMLQPLKGTLAVIVCSLPTTFDVNNDLIYCSNMCYTYWYMLVSL